MPVIIIENIIANATINQEIDLNTLVSTVPSASMVSDNAKLCSVTIHSPHLAFFIQSNGTIQCTGAHCMDELTQGFAKLQELVSPAHLTFPTDLKPTITQVIASTHTEKCLDLSQVKTMVTDGTITHNPEHDEWLEYTTDMYQNTVILVFATGKLVACGPSIKIVSDALEHTITTLIEINGKE